MIAQRVASEIFCDSTIIEQSYTKVPPRCLVQTASIKQREFGKIGFLNLDCYTRPNATDIFTAFSVL